ncbi:AraC family transcriptional regulator [Salmonella enterica]|nr:helix-turn-helix domain-containing protein [Salmonella enterica]ECD4514772.1 helix-turn-helix domain-containing protein [Salmonella enterica subsp. enterica serovar Sandiego]ECF1356170.1 helix-turn-helix domain-containing protein [Salmonella enterica subsp. enterica serovar Sandiego]ECV4068487.1 helix-turn-helix domain-containing protein [Salmonella enterica]ECZ0995784.1 AraC family transcriptional regulator [Salmonella enterica]
MTLWQLTEWIEQNLHQPLPLSVLAEKIGCSTRQLGNQFREAFGDTPAAYIWKRRLTLASTLLRFTRRSITEIALMYQFSHLSSFARAFKHQFGLAPQAYRLADNWDMALFYPSVTVTNFTCHTDIIYIPENIYILPQNNRKQEMHFGLDYIINTEKGKIISDRQIHQRMIELIFRKTTIYPMVVYGTVFPGKECDTELDIVLGTLSPVGDKNQRVYIPAGNYACFTFKGSPMNIMQFHSWAKGHGMHIHHLVMKKGPTFSIFDKTLCENVYKTEYYIPCQVGETMSARP